jgi:TPR repeat protein
MIAIAASVAAVCIGSVQWIGVAHWPSSEVFCLDSDNLMAHQLQWVAAGDPEIAFTLALHSLSECGLMPDGDALTWLRRAAVRGDGVYAAAYADALGASDPADGWEKLYWYEVAVERGYGAAAEQIDHLSPSLQSCVMR